ncbi:MAG: ABC-type amino acid transport system, periplasmic component [Herbinix sp.]|jgi:cystine transport system substrate-binding protein|nr:ABC-type amino acid transport system, periplasmic component [Herbinix sp.]
MMKRKKIMVAVLTLVLLAGVMSGCTSNKVSESSESKELDITPTVTAGAVVDDTEVKDLLTQIGERGKLLIGTEGTYAPYTYHDATGDLVGYDVEIARAIAEKLGVEAEFVETNWDACIAGLDAERYDVVMNQVGITEERLLKYDFSTPYTVTNAVLIAAEDNKDLTSFEDLKGKKAAQSLTSNYAILAESYGAEIVSTDGMFSKAIELVSTGRAEATINDEASFYDFLKQQPDATVKIIDTLDEASENAVLIRKGNDTFVTAVNKALDELSQDGTLAEISDKYFGADITK